MIRVTSFFCLKNENLPKALNILIKTSVTTAVSLNFPCQFKFLPFAVLAQVLLLLSMALFALQSLLPV